MPTETDVIDDSPSNNPLSTLKPCKSLEYFPVAMALLQSQWLTPAKRQGLVVHDGNLYEWHGNSWVPRTFDDLTCKVRLLLAKSIWIKVSIVQGQPMETEERVYPSNNMVKEVADALWDICRSQFRSIPCWLDGGRDKPLPSRCIAFDDVIVDIAGSTLDNIVTLPRDETWFDAGHIAASFDPNAPAERFEQCLREWGGDDPEWTELLLRELGYNLMAHRDYQRWFLHYGKIRGGKGTISHILRTLMGVKWMAGDPETITNTHGLQGYERARNVTFGELYDMDKGAGAKAGSLIKKIVGRSEVTINPKNKAQELNKIIDAVVTVESNEVPKLPNKGQGLSGKMIVVPFDHSFVGKEEYGLADRLVREELPGIAAMLVKAAIRLEREEDPKKKFVMPERAVEVLERYELLNNGADHFLRWGFVRKDTGWVSHKLIKARYMEWVKKAKIKAMPDTKIIQWLIDESTWNLNRHRTSDQRGLKGLSLRSETGPIME